MMKRVRLAMIILITALCTSGPGWGASSAQQTGLIASWNIMGVDPIPESRIKRIADVIRRLNPDLVVLSEVNPNDVPEKIVQELGAEYDKPAILPQQEGVVQNIAFVFKKGVSVSGTKLIEGTDLAEEPRSRKALTANVRIGNFDFILIGVHLKSSRTAAARAQRSRQAEAIAAFIAKSVTQEEKDVLVVGDYNMIPRTGSTRNDEVNFFAMSPNSFLRFVSTESLAGQTSHIGSCNPLRGNLLDGFAISRTFTREYVSGSTRLVSFRDLATTCAEFKNGVSDHRPVLSRFRIAKDDD